MNEPVIDMHEPGLDMTEPAISYAYEEILDVAIPQDVDVAEPAIDYEPVIPNKELEDWASICLATGWTFDYVRSLTPEERNAIVKVANQRKK